MNGRQLAILKLADRAIAQLDASLAQMPQCPRQRDPERCPRVACGAEMGRWQRDAVPGARWRRCTKCHYREQKRFDHAHWYRVKLERAEKGR